jgi:hypothetical protein
MHHKDLKQKRNQQLVSFSGNSKGRHLRQPPLLKATCIYGSSSVSSFTDQPAPEVNT